MTEVTHPLLLAYDGSETSAVVIDTAGGLLAEREALVCHVWSGLSRAMLHADPDELPRQLRTAAAELDEADQEAAERIAADGAQLALAAGFQAEPVPVREQRKVWRTLLAVAERRTASAIVAGAHGVSGLERALLGSISTALLHHSTVPVLVIRQTAAEEPGRGPLLLCYGDQSPRSTPSRRHRASAPGVTRSCSTHGSRGSRRRRHWPARARRCTAWRPSSTRSPTTNPRT